MRAGSELLQRDVRLSAGAAQGRRSPLEPVIDASARLAFLPRMGFFVNGLGGCVVASGLLLGGCMAPTGPHIRVATATADQLKSVEGQDDVWYEFMPGDVIPVQFGYLGAVEGGSRGPAAFRAKQHFFLVATKQGGIQISFDGKSFAGPESSQSVIAVVPRKDGHGGQLVWVIYMGESGDPKAELQKVIAESSAKPE